MRLDKRVADLEAKRPSDNLVTSHLIGMSPGQTNDEAIFAYGSERVGPDDMVIFLVGVPPDDVRHVDVDPTGEGAGHETR